MDRILVCVDGSAYADNICRYAAWIHKRFDAKIELLHVLRRHSEYMAPSSDHTGSIGLGARSELLEELTKVDEERGQLDQKKGQVILDHAQKTIREAGVAQSNLIHRRGSLVETIQELEPQADMIFIGKRGEHANTESDFLGSNLEKVARSIHKPLFVVPSKFRKIQKVLIAYDGKENISKAMDYIITHKKLFSDLELHLLAVEKSPGSIDLSELEKKLKAENLLVKISAQTNDYPDETITQYVEENKIDLLITGAYSHSRIRSIFLGSTTAVLIKSCRIPLLMFR